MKRHSTDREFIEWILENNRNVADTDIEDLDYLARKIADNLFVYQENLDTAKIDFLAFLKILKLNDIIFKELQHSNHETEIHSGLLR